MDDIVENRAISLVHTWLLQGLSNSQVLERIEYFLKESGVSEEKKQEIREVVEEEVGSGVN